MPEPDTSIPATTPAAPAGVAISADEHAQLVKDAEVGRQFKERAEELSEGDADVYNNWVKMTRGDVTKMDQLETRPVTDPPPPEPEPREPDAPITRAELDADRVAMLNDVKTIVAAAVTDSVAPLERARNHDRRTAERDEATKIFGTGDDAGAHFKKHWDAKIAPMLEQRPGLSELTIPELVRMTGYDDHVKSARAANLEARKEAFRSGLHTFAPPATRRASPVNRTEQPGNPEKKTMRQAALDIVLEHYSDADAATR